MTIDNCITLNKTDIDRFKKYISICPHTDKWEWVGGKSSSGYGQFWLNGKTVSAHRISYMIKHGEIQEGLFVCHKYENLGRDNVNPDHLFLGSSKDNMLDAAKKGRTLKGVRNPASKLTEKQVLDIASSDEIYSKLSEIYGVSEAMIGKIKRGYEWSSITGIKPTEKYNLKNKSGYIGVRSPRTKKNGWAASIGRHIEGKYKSKYLGTYATAIEAARAYDSAAIVLHGEKAKLNFPNK